MLLNSPSTPPNSASIRTRCATSTAQERDKRIRPEGNDQYVEVTGKFAHFVDDPYVERVHARAADRRGRRRRSSAAASAACWPARGSAKPASKNIRIIEAGGDFGGTWYWNRYPGAQCDIESYCYLPLLEELGYMPKEKYSFAPEIYEHSQRIARHYDLYDDGVLPDEGDRTCAGTRPAARWIVTTDRNDAMKARFVVMATGPLNRPKLPAIPGIEEFDGPHVPHQPLGLRLHRRQSQRRPDEARRQTRRDHRHRRNRHSVRAVRRRIREAAVRVPAHAVVGRSARQQTDRSRMGENAEAGLAARAAREFQRDGHRPAGGRGPRQRRLDRDLPQSRAHVAATQSGRFEARSGDAGRNRRLQEDERHPRARRRTP